MAKIRLDLEAVDVDTFDPAARPLPKEERGTVHANQMGHTGPYSLTCLLGCWETHDDTCRFTCPVGCVPDME